MEKNDVFYIPSELTHGRGYVYCLQYHIVWCTKYRKNVLAGSIEQDLKFILLSLTQDLGITIQAMEIMPDHVHLLIETRPQCRISDAVKVLKGTSAWHLFKQHPELKASLWGGRLWNPSYFVATVSDRTAEQVTNYIAGQKTAPGKPGRPKGKA
ncbi:MAG: IS200/IS605 family transposase [Roseburia faecis]|nr:IS200/IS605 family transposase [Roseburia faecis]